MHQRSVPPLACQNTSSKQRWAALLREMRRLGTGAPTAAAAAEGVRAQPMSPQEMETLGVK
jgi:hypothetical protein